MERDTLESSTQRNPDRESGEAKQQTATALRELQVPEAVSVGRLAELMRASPILLMKQLMRAGIMANINQVIDFETTAALVPVFGFRAVPQDKTPRESQIGESEEDDPALLQARPPVVTVLGHVDHGKTTLLDSIRKTNVAEREAGGITQHIGAYQAEFRDHKITFLDTPGHAAFTAMRARGAEVTDIVVLVVAADDGVMPQTVEAINHAKAAKVSFVVAVNKIDRPDADVERTKRQLAEHDLLIEEWGGDVVVVPVSATSGEGIEELLESILVVAEMAELKANPDRLASGVVVEARLDKSRGPVGTFLVNTGTFKIGDHLVAGIARGKVKAIYNDVGQRIGGASPSMPVEVLGLDRLPTAGDTFIVVESERKGRAIVEERERQQETIVRGANLKEMFNRIRTGETKELNLVIKADAQGSVEALRDSLSRLSTDKAHVRIIHAASGSITESDVLLAVASHSIIVGFNTTVEPGARHLAETEGVETRLYAIIYRLLDDVQDTLQGLIEPETVDIVEGHGTVRAVFSRGRHHKIAGVYVTDGRVLRSALVRIVRNAEIIHDGPISSLRHFKDDVREIAAGLECGIGLSGFDDFQDGDVLEIHQQERVRS